MRRVLSWGNPASRLVLIGEAPGQTEEELGEPFVGASGFKLKEWWASVGLRREDFYILNVVEYRPPHNNIAAFDIGYLKQWMAYLHVRLAHCTNPSVIVPTGNYALYALTGKGKVKWQTKDGKSARAGITDWRGSILSYTMTDGRVVKVIPTIHPAAVSPSRSPEYEPVCRRDWQRIAEEAKFPELNLPQRTHHINPSLTEATEYLTDLLNVGVVAVDIENPATRVRALDAPTGSGKAKVQWVKGPRSIVCVGFSPTPNESMTIPTTLHYWQDEDKLRRIWQQIRGVLMSQWMEKIFHNGLYDTFHLEKERNIRVEQWLYDTLYMSHCLDPSDWHSLDYCASRETRQPYWKTIHKDDASLMGYDDFDTAFYTYNGIDVCVTRELYDIYRARLEKEGRWAFYLSHYPKLFRPLHALQLHGIQVDDKMRRHRLAHLMANGFDTQRQLTEMTGMDLYGEKAISTKKLQYYLYTVLGLPEQQRKRKDKGTHTVTSDELAVKRLMEKYPSKLKASGTLILTHRRTAKLQDFYAEKRVDPDGRFRSSYSMNTEAARLSSSRNPNGTGSNAQNIDHEVRDIFLPDDGYVGCYVDLSGAEARIDYALIYHLTGDKALYEKAWMRPDEYDQHTENASYIFKKPTNEVTKDERYIGKKAVHGAFRDLHGKKLSEELFKEGYVVTEKEAQGYLNAFKARVPGIEDLFRWVRRRMLQDRYLQNSWGYRLSFEHDQFNDETYRRGYSFDAQSECAFWLNHLGFLPLYDLLVSMRQTEACEVGRINAHVHDALFFSVLPKYAYHVVSTLVSLLERERALWGVTLRIPCTVQVGQTWKGDHEWKRLPSREEFESAIATEVTE